MIKKGIYVGENSLLFKKGEKIYVEENQHYPDRFCVFVNPDGTGWVCNIPKDNFKESV